MHFSQLRYGLAVLALTLALLIMQLLDPLIFEQKSPFLVVLAIAVILSTWYGGMRTGLFATVLVAFAYDYFLASPNYSLLGINPKENLQISLFLSEGVLISWLTRLVRGLKLPTQLNTLKFQQHQNNTDQDIKLLQKYYQLLCEQTGNIVLFLRRDGRIIAANQAAVKAYGYSQEELLSLKLQDLTVPNDSVDLEKMAQADNQGALVKTIHRHKDGKTFPVEVSVQSPVIGPEKVFLSMIHHITEQQATPLLLQGEQQYRALADAMPLIVWTAQPDGTVNDFNQWWLDYTGMTLEQTKGWGWQSVIHPEDLQRCLDCWNEALQTGKPYEIEYRFQRKDGRYRWHLGRALPMRDQEGQIVCWVGTCTDIEQQKQTEETERFLAEANQELASSLDYQTTLTNVARLSVPRIADWCAIDMVDEDQAIRRLAVVHADPSKVTWAQELQKRYPPYPDDPYGVANALRTGRSELYPEVSDDLLVAIARDAEHLSVLRQVGFTSAMVVPLIVRRRILGAITLVSAESGRRYDASDLDFAEELARRASLAIDSASLLKAVQQELSCRIQTEAALRESEERFRTMADSAPVLLWVAGTDGLCTFFNQGWLTFRGRTLAQELGNGWAEGIHSEDQKNCLDVYKAAFQTRQNFEREFRLLRADGEYRWVVDRGTPRFLSDGSFVGYIGSCTDITEQKSTEQALRDRARELATLSAVLAETNASLEKRNRELDQFAYAASHDLKAPLRAIAHLSSWIEEDTQDQLSEETRHQMNLLRGRVNRMEALIEGLLQYSRFARMKPLAERVSIEELLVAIIDSLAPPPEFIITVKGPMPTLDTEKTLLEQVFANLISNGIKHHNRLDGKMTISIQEQGDFWEFAIADDGPGVDSRYHDKIFMMFQTLEARDKVENLGVGLAIVKKIIENKGGNIRLESQIGQGATFYFTWPKSNDGQENDKPATCR